jgi:predicted membrane metal-binding protein
MISGILALLSVLPVMNVCSDQGPCGVFLVLGLVGIFFSGIVSNVHNPNALLGALLNWVIFATVAIVLLKLWARWRGRGTDGNR